MYYVSNICKWQNSGYISPLVSQQLPTHKNNQHLIHGELQLANRIPNNHICTWKQTIQKYCFELADYKHVNGFMVHTSITCPFGNDDVTDSHAYNICSHSNSQVSVPRCRGLLDASKSEIFYIFTNYKPAFTKMFFFFGKIAIV